jgi:hypothetical protein
MTRKFIPLRTFFCDKNGKLVIFQLPNLPLATWLVFAVLSHLFAPGHVRTVAHDISRVALIVWASLEVYSGASYFRRVLGLAVLVLSIASFW